MFMLIVKNLWMIVNCIFQKNFLIIYKIKKIMYEIKRIFRNCI